MTTPTTGISPDSKTPSLLDLPASKLWRSSAPVKIVADWKVKSPEENWQRIQSYFSERKVHRAVRDIFHGKVSPVTWALPNKYISFLEWHKKLINQLESKSPSSSLSQLLSSWLDSVNLKQPKVTFALQTLSWTYLLPELTATLDSKSWWQLVDLLVCLAEESEACLIDDDSSLEELLSFELLAGELPLALSVMLPELKPTKTFAESARKRLSQSIIELTDGEGLLKAELLSVSQMLLASWTRCRAIGQATNKGAFSTEATTQYEWLIQQVLRLSDRNGRMPFEPEASLNVLPLLQYAIEKWGDSEDENAATRRLKRFKVKAVDNELPKPSNDSEWACLTTLSAGWSDKSPRFTVDYSSETLRLELIFEGKVLVSGDWSIEATRNGQQLRADDSWDVNCWYSDEDCDYLELSIDLNDGSQLERMILLAREDGVAMLGEILLGPEDSKQSTISISSKLSLANNVSIQEETETRDVFLTVNDKPTCGIIPLALPEWKVDRQVGELGIIDNHLVFCAEAEGRNLASPIWIDFSKNRFAKQRTWRQLTVGHSLNKVANDVAVAYRIQSGKDQWLVYRSLDQRANRTVLGQNLSSEALYGKFLKTGEVDEYLEISGDED